MNKFLICAACRPDEVRVQVLLRLDEIGEDDKSVNAEVISFSTKEHSGGGNIDTLGPMSPAAQTAVEENELQEISTKCGGITYVSTIAHQTTSCGILDGRACQHGGRNGAGNGIGQEGKDGGKKGADQESCQGQCWRCERVGHTADAPSHGQ